MAHTPHDRLTWRRNRASLKAQRRDATAVTKCRTRVCVAEKERRPKQDQQSAMQVYKLKVNEKKANPRATQSRQWNMSTGTVHSATDEHRGRVCTKASISLASADEANVEQVISTASHHHTHLCRRTLGGHTLTTGRLARGKCNAGNCIAISRVDQVQGCCRCRVVVLIHSR